MNKILFTLIIGFFSSSVLAEKFTEEVAIYNQEKINENSFDTQMVFRDDNKCEYLAILTEDKKLIDKDKMYLRMFPNSKKIKANFKFKKCNNLLFKYENELKIGYVGDKPIEAFKRFYVFDEKELDKK